MQKLFALLVLVLAVGVLRVRAQSAEDQYVGIYILIQQADALAASQPAEALPQYLAAQTSLQRLQQLNPNWNPKVVNFRLGYLADKISELRSVKPRPAAPVVATKPDQPELAVPGRATETQPPPVTEAEQQIRGLQDDVRRLQADKAILEAKVREALATQPAAIDPRELVKAQEKIQALLKENELLKATAGAEPGKPLPAAEPKELEESRRALVEANRKLTEQTAAARQLALEQEALQQRLLRLAASAEAADALRAENELLKQQLTQQKNVTPPASLVEAGNRRALEAEARLAALQSDTEILRLEKSALESRLKTNAPVRATAAGGREADRQRIKRLETERDAALKKLSAAGKTTLPSSNQELTAQVGKLTQEVAGMRARLSVFEAQKVPYSVEELALFKQPAPQPVPAESAAGKKLIQQLPAGTTALAAEAQRHFAAREFDQAEAKYQAILQQDDKNSATLGNLARVQIENHHFEEAEKNIRLALTTAPDDPYNLFMLGYLKLQQEKYDEAVAPLSRAVEANPKSAEIQNCLGVTLSHVGLRGPAETAFRKAIQIDAAYGSAHNNLAVLYAGQTPPLVELARWHYQKALAAGLAKNPDLEKLLDRKTAALPN